MVNDRNQRCNYLRICSRQVFAAPDLDCLLTYNLAMKPLFTKSVRDRVINSKNSPTAFGSRYGHQMIPLSGHDKTKPKSTYNAQATGNHRVGSEEHIMSHKGGVIEYEREFTVEESYIGTPPEEIAEQHHKA